MIPGALLGGSRVVELATEIAGPYCGKMLTDAGADVVKLEPPGGDPLRRWTASDHDLGGADGALFQYLNASKRSIEMQEPAAQSVDLDRLLPGCRLVVESGQLTLGEIAAIRHRHPHVSVVSISSCGKSNPWSDLPWTEFTLQAHCGSIAGRGDPDRMPFYAGGRLGEWAAGTYAAVAAATLLYQSHHRRRSDHADISMLASMTMTMTSYRSLRKGLMASGTYDNSRALDVPSIEPTKDGYVGFALATRQQYNDLLAMIERPDLIGDDDLASTLGRRRRRAEFLGYLHSWTMRHTSEEIVDLASAFRVPVALISEPETILQADHFVERGVFVSNADGSFLQPRPPYRVDGHPPPSIGRSPKLGEHREHAPWAPVTEQGAPSTSRPLEGLRVIDLTAFWAGPSASQVLALLGADVIKVESVQRPDSMRFTGCRPPSESDWWEYGYFFQALNAEKRGITINLTSAAGRDLLLAMLCDADVLMENFTPRVMDAFGLDQSTLHSANPNLIVTRMPGFGLDGPWRDRPGFAQNMEQASGMAWMTGYPDGPPCTVPGLCDPVAGMHGAFATIAALIERDRTSNGHLVESSMIEAALNLAAEMVLEFTAYGRSLQRSGNRGPGAVPQGVFRAAGGQEVLVAIAVTSDEQWEAFVDVLEVDELRSAAYSSVVGRRVAEESLETRIREAISGRDGPDIVLQLLSRGVPASLVVSGEDVMELEALRSSGFVEVFSHRIAGTHELYVLPFRISAEPRQWIHHAAPTLGQHNEEVLDELLGFGPATVQCLRESAVIGERPLGA